MGNDQMRVLLVCKQKSPRRRTQEVDQKAVHIIDDFKRG